MSPTPYQLSHRRSLCRYICLFVLLEVQYGSPLPLYPRSRYDHIDGAAHYTMVYEDPVEKSGLITAINMDVAAINRHISIGVFKKTGPGNCDFMLTKEVPLHRMADYQPHVQVYGLQTVNTRYLVSILLHLRTVI